MAWEHKEEYWQKKFTQSYDRYEGPHSHWGWVVSDGLPGIEKMEPEEWAENGDIEFPDWLDLHCVGGWEVLKISRNFNDQHLRTWVVFRKQA